MIYEVSHRTTVSYATVVRLARFNLRLKPAAWPGQILRDYTMDVTPRPASVREEVGPYVVNRSRLTLKEPISTLTIESRFRVEVQEAPVILGGLFEGKARGGPSVRQIRNEALTGRDLSATCPASYLYPSRIAAMSPEIGVWARPFLADDVPVIDAGTALMHAIFEQFKYDKDATKTDTPPADAFAKKRGVCQDFAHIMVIAARAHGIPAAYVSGYLRTLPPPGKPRLIGADAMHAWTALWCGPALGWIGFDPTNDKLANTDYIFIGMGRDYGDVSPLDGVFHGGAGQTMRVAVDVMPLEVVGVGYVALFED